MRISNRCGPEGRDVARSDIADGLISPHAIGRVMRRVICLFLALVFCAAAAQADAVSDFYKGKTVTIVVGFSTGGIYDIWARLISRHLRRHIPGNPNVIVQNKGGAGGLTAANYVVSIAPKDGTVIAAAGNLNPFAPFLGITEARFDATKLQWLGSPTQDVAMVLVWHTVPVNTLDDLKTHEVVLGSTSPDGASSFYGRVIADIFKVKFRFVYGFPGLANTDLAIERGEVDGHPSVFWNHLSAAKPDWLKEKKVKILLQYGAKPRPELPDTPFARQLPMSDADRQFLDASMAPLALGYPYFMAPGTPADRVSAMRQAFKETFEDAAFLAEAKKQDLEVDPIAPDGMAKIVDEAYGVPRSVADRVLALYARK